jgi:hypothetical protein
MDKEYIEKKIKTELVNKDFELWDKDSINFLVSIFEFEKYGEYYNINLMLLNDYIIWYKKNNCQNAIHNQNMYTLKELMNIYCIINEDIYHNVHYNYINILNKNKNYNYICDDFTSQFNILINNNLFFMIVGTMLTIFYIILRYILFFIPFKKNEEKKNIYEIKIPLPDNFINNNLLKFFIGENKDLPIKENNPLNYFDKYNITDNLLEKIGDIMKKII